MSKELETLESKLKEQISLEFDKCCHPALKSLTEYIDTPEGRSRAESIVFEMCSTQGIAIQTAMSLLDSDLPETHHED